jgi:hypothetical protein
MNWRLASLLFVAGACTGQLDTPTGSGDPPGSTQPDAGTMPTPPTPDAPPALTPLEILGQWSGCLTLQNFQAANMAEAWGNMAAQNNQLCRNCHGVGDYGFIATDDENLFFTTMTEHSSYLVKYFSIQGTDIIVNTGSVTNAGTTLAGHPRFDPINNPGMLALQKLYTDTKALKDANTCEPSRLKD